MTALSLSKDDPALGGYVTIRRAMSVLGVSRYRVMAMIARGDLKAEMVAETPLIAVESVNAVLESRREGTATAVRDAATAPSEA